MPKKNKDNYNVLAGTISPTIPAKNGDKHTWFSEKIPKYDMEIPTINSMTIYMSAFMEKAVSMSNLVNDIRSLSRKDMITLVFNSPGGLVSEGRALINSVKSTGAFIQTEILSAASSMAAVSFCIGDRRVVYENSSLMFHNFSGGVAGKGHDMKRKLNHQIDNISGMFTEYIIGLTSKEMRKLHKGEEFWFGSRDMCKRGIATHVNIKGILLPAEDYLKILSKVKKRGLKKGITITSLAQADTNNIFSLSKLIKRYNKKLSKKNKPFNCR